LLPQMFYILQYKLLLYYSFFW